MVNWSVANINIAPYLSGTTAGATATCTATRPVVAYPAATVIIIATCGIITATIALPVFLRGLTLLQILKPSQYLLHRHFGLTGFLRYRSHARFQPFVTACLDLRIRPVGSDVPVRHLGVLRFGPGRNAAGGRVLGVHLALDHERTFGLGLGPGVRIVGLVAEALALVGGCGEAVQRSCPKCSREVVAQRLRVLEAFPPPGLIHRVPCS